MPPADSHAKREFASLKGRLGSRVTLAKSNKRGSLGGLFFSGKARKECFSFYEKHKRDGFCVLFAFAKRTKRTFLRYFLRRAKSNQKHAEGCDPLDSRGAVQSSTQACFYRN